MKVKSEHRVVKRQGDVSAAANTNGRLHRLPAKSLSRAEPLFGRCESIAMTKREPDTPHWQPFSIKRLLRMVSGLVFVNEADELGEADDGEPIIARAERRLNEMLAARRETHARRASPPRTQD